jgi:diguanylate cyclase (GGDEF)-like protein
MTKLVRCPECGEATGTSSCQSCGAELSDPLGDDRAASELDRDATTQDQTRADDDQTASDQDQTSSDRDQAGSESDQRSADEDQHAADDDFAAGGDPIAYHRSALARGRSSRDRVEVAASRDEAAAARHRTADDRDRDALLRDRGAEGRDALARLHDLQDDDDLSLVAVVFRAARDRARAAADRAKAADDRTRALADRNEAARERAEALRRISESADDLKYATTDQLTGGWTRKSGLEAVSRELERAHRTGATLVLAFIDVDGLRQVNDSQGHVAGDALLHLVGETLRANVRPYDVIVRYGGDELLCAMANLTAAQARTRFERIAAELSVADADHSVTFGIVEAGAADTLQELIARADAALLQASSLRAHHRDSAEHTEL